MLYQLLVCTSEWRRPVNWKWWWRSGRDLLSVWLFHGIAKDKHARHPSMCMFSLRQGAPSDAGGRAKPAYRNANTLPKRWQRQWIVRATAAVEVESVANIPLPEEWQLAKCNKRPPIWSGNLARPTQDAIGPSVRLLGIFRLPKSK